MAPIERNRSAILTGDTAQYFLALHANCSRESYDRTIDEVKVESDSRATVFATIKNITPISEARNKGQKYRYVPERETGRGSWKVSEGYEQDQYAADGSNWRLEYNPRYQDAHAYVYAQ